MLTRLLLLLLIIANSLSLAAQNEEYSSAFYLEKSRNQKTAAFVTGGVSLGTLVWGITLLDKTKPGWERSDPPTAIAGAGLLMIGTGMGFASIILFSSSSANKKRAEHLELVINKPISVYTGSLNIVLPYSVGIKLSIR